MINPIQPPLLIQQCKKQDNAYTDRSDHTPANKHGAEESGRVDQTVDGVYKNAAHNKIPFLLTEKQ